LSPNQRRLLFTEQKRKALRLQFAADPNRAIGEIVYLLVDVLRERDLRRAD
jgi:hypothetical protein